jgi:hypothetical protein
VLPDYPAIKRSLAEALEERLRIRFLFYLGPLAEIGHHRQFEGHQIATARPEGERVDDPRELLETITIRIDEVPTLTLATIMARLDEAARKLAQAHSRMVYEQIDQAVSDVGNTVDCRGEALSARHLLAMIDKVQIDFDDRGQPELPSLFINPQNQKAVERAFEELNSDPELAGLWRAIIDRKREEWRDREASRGLAG